MPVPHTPIPSFLPTLHLYRHLLRETTYLPPAWRSNVANLIRDRFKSHKKKDDDSTHKKRARAYNVLGTLRAANSGDKKAMETLIMKGFGRQGVRRRQLLMPFLHNEGPGNTEALEALLAQEEAGEPISDDATESTEKSPKPRKNAFYHKWDTKKLKQLLQSQKEVQSQNRDIWITRAIKVLDDNQFVPKETMWGKKPVERLVESKRAKWWRGMADKTMPPLGQGEWELLGHLSQGEQGSEEWKVPQRRALATSINGEIRDEWDWKSYATKPAVDAERPRSYQATLRTGQRDPGPFGAQRKGKELSDRWFRRTYNRTWQMSPKMDQDPQSLKYSFDWGKPKNGLVSASKAQLEIFDGVDSKGRKLPDP